MLEHLKQITKVWADTAPTPAEIEAYQGLGLRSSPADAVRRAKQSTASIILANVADAQGDVDAYMARYSAEQLTYGTIAPDVAQRLLAAARHLAECASADAAISDYGTHPAHGQFVETLRGQHGRKYGFWGLVDG